MYNYQIDEAFPGVFFEHLKCLVLEAIENNPLVSQLIDTKKITDIFNNNEGYIAERKK